MKINKIDRIGIAQTSAFLLITMGIFVNHEDNQNRHVDNLRTQVLNTDSARYTRVQKRADNMPLQIKTQMWENAYEEMQDSLKTIGKAQKNYFIGSQGAKIK